ncbi:MAG: hypothetical protein AB7T06_36470 [Kofleriaceae bacterium]
MEGKVDPWDPANGLTLDPDNPGHYLWPTGEVIEIEGTRPSANLIAKLQHGELDGKRLAAINKFIDADGDGYLTIGEVKAGMESIVFTPNQWAVAMRLEEQTGNQPYRYGADVNAFIDANYPDGSAAAQDARLVRIDETARRSHTDGFEYTNAANAGRSCGR